MGPERGKGPRERQFFATKQDVQPKKGGLLSAPRQRKNTKGRKEFTPSVKKHTSTDKLAGAQRASRHIILMKNGWCPQRTRYNGPARPYQEKKEFLLDSLFYSLFFRAGEFASCCVGQSPSFTPFCAYGDVFLIRCSAIFFYHGPLLFYFGLSVGVRRPLLSGCPVALARKKAAHAQPHPPVAIGL